MKKQLTKVITFSFNSCSTVIVIWLRFGDSDVLLKKFNVFVCVSISDMVEMYWKKIMLGMLFNIQFVIHSMKGVIRRRILDVEGSKLP